jgi:hypothetical protein
MKLSRLFYLIPLLLTTGLMTGCGKSEGGDQQVSVDGGAVGSLVST